VNATLKEIRIPLLIDAGLLLFILVQVGIGWQRLGHLENQVNSMVNRGERLARIETKVDRAQADIDRILIRLDRKNGSGRKTD